MTINITRISNVKECLAILKDPTHFVPEYGTLLQELGTATAKSFTLLKIIFSLNLFALNGEEHRLKRRMLAKYLNRNSLAQFRDKFVQITEDEFSSLTENDVDLTIFCERVSYRCIYAYLGLHDGHHNQYLACLDAVRAIIGFESQKKLKDYERAESCMRALYDIMFSHGGLLENGLLSRLNNDLESENELFAITTVLLAGSGALASTFANMILHFCALDTAVRQQAIATQGISALVEKLLFSSGGTKEIFRTTQANRNELIFLDIDAASKQFVTEYVPIAGEAPPNWGNLAFGAGVHRCIGEGLSREVLELAFAAFVTKYPNAELLETDRREFFLGCKRETLYCRLQP